MARQLTLSRAKNAVNGRVDDSACLDSLEPGLARLKRRRVPLGATDNSECANRASISLISRRVNLIVDLFLP
jgi:hypothetical protein